MTGISVGHTGGIIIIIVVQEPILCQPARKALAREVG